MPICGRNILSDGEMRAKDPLLVITEVMSNKMCVSISRTLFYLNV